MVHETSIKEADLRIQSVSFGEITYPPGGRLGPRLQTNLQLVIVHSGQMDVEVDNGRFLVEENNVMLLLPGHTERFAFSQTQETWHSWVQATIDPFSNIVQQYITDLPRPILVSPVLRNLMSEALKLKHARLPTREPILKTIATYMFWQYLGEAELLLEKGEGKSASRTVEKARDFMHRNLDNDLYLETIAQAANISRSQLTRLFKTELNITPIAYLWQQRVKLGVDMLRNTGLPVGTIADRCGFKNHYHFSRSVRQATQMSPRKLRQTWWQNGN